MFYIGSVSQIIHKSHAQAPPANPKKAARPDLKQLQVPLLDCKSPVYSSKDTPLQQRWPFNVSFQESPPCIAKF